MDKIKHKQKHQILKDLAEAGREILMSDLPNKRRFALYGKLNKLVSNIYLLEETDECSCEVERETDELMELNEALDCLSDGHALWTPKIAYQICKAVGVPYDKSLERHWYSDWSDPKGMHMSEGYEGSIGVAALSLSHYVAKQLGVAEKAGSYLGRGFQAQAYAREIRKEVEHGS